jgi:hypothetical protein
MELSARLFGDLHDREVNLGFVIDPSTAERMAQMFLARRKAAILVESTEEEG